MPKNKTYSKEFISYEDVRKPSKMPVSINNATVLPASNPLTSLQIALEPSLFLRKWKQVLTGGRPSEIHLKFIPQKIIKSNTFKMYLNTKYI